MKTGDKVMIRYAGRDVIGEIKLASPNERSLLLVFDTILGGYVNAMPVMKEGDGIYYELFNHEPVIVERMS